MAENTLENTDMLEQDPPKGGSSFLNEFNQSLSQSIAKVAPEPQPLTLAQKINAPVGPAYALPVSDDQINMYRYQDGFKEESFNPFDSSNYQKFADKETWGTALSKGFDSFGYKFGNTFVDYWKGYGRMADALLSWDWSKMLPDEETMANQYYEDQKDMYKNFVFEQPDTEDSLFSKRSVSELIGNTGFALGTFAGLGLEIAADIAVTALSGGAGAVSFFGTAAKVAAKEAVEQGVKAAAKKAFNFTDMLADVGKGFTMANRSEDEFSAAAKVINQMDEASKIANMSKSGATAALNATFDVFSNNILNVAKSKTFLEGAENLIKSTPLAGTALRYGEKFTSAIKGGASAGQLLGIGLQGVRRVAQELNMSATEASFEAVTSYGDTLDKMVQDYQANNDGKVPSSAEFEQMKQLANKASAANYNTNMALLLATNKIQFGNIFNKFIPANKFMSEAAENILKVERKGLSQVYRKGAMGTFGVAGQIAEDFGKREAAYQIGKSMFKNTFLKFSLSEGIQENLQETSAAAWRDYYASQFEGTGTTLKEAFGEGISEQFTKQGLKTFLMGAVTGTLISGPTRLATGAMDAAQRAAINRQYKDNPQDNPLTQQEAQLDADLMTQNAILKQVAQGKFENKTFNFNAQTQAAQDMSYAAAKGDRYEFENAKDNALIAAVASAKRTGTQDVLFKAVSNMGAEMSNEEFEASFGVKLEDTGFSSAAEFTQNVASKIKRYSKTIDDLTSHVKSRMADPSQYAPGTNSQYAAMLTRKAQEDAIQFIALNQLKGTASAERAKQVASDLLSVPGMQNSSDYAIRVLTNAANLEGEIGNIAGEIRVLRESLTAEGIDPETKADIQKQLDNKIEEQALLNKWIGYWENRKRVVGETEEGDTVERDKVNDIFLGKNKGTIEETDEDGNPTGNKVPQYDHMDPEVLDTFRKLVNIKNKQVNNNTEISEQALQDGFQKVYDYIRLDRDTRDYMRSVDVLMNADNYMAATERMVDGNFKYNLLLYVDMLLTRAEMQAIFLMQKAGVSNPADMEAFVNEVITTVQDSDAYKKILVLAANPDITVKEEDYAQQLSKDIEKLIQETVARMSAKYGSQEFTGDIPEAEYDQIIATKKLDAARRNIIAGKVADNETLTEREQKVYEMFKEDIDKDAQFIKAQDPVEEASLLDDIPVVGVVDADGNLSTETEEIPETGESATEEVTTIEMAIAQLEANLERERSSEFGSPQIVAQLEQQLQMLRQAQADQATSQPADADMDAKLADIQRRKEEIDNWQLPKKVDPAKQFVAEPRLVAEGNEQKIVDLLNEILDEALATPSYSNSINRINGAQFVKDTSGMYDDERAIFLETIKNRYYDMLDEELAALGQPPVSRPSLQANTDTSVDEEIGTEGQLNYDAQQLAFFGIESETDPEEDRLPSEKDGEQYGVTGSTESGFDVVDKAGHTVNAEPIPSEEEAEETADSLNATFNDLEFAQQLLRQVNADMKDPNLAVRFMEKAQASMKTSNSREKTMFSSLEEYYRTPNGKRRIEAIRESVITGRPVNYKTKKAAVSVTPATTQLPLFGTTTTTATKPALTLESLQELYAKAVEIREQALQNTEKNGKFVEEGQIIEDLRKITSCFS